ncbi:MAG: hypothetical protein ACW976_03790 [Candidatus Ranarchaeia archaeon]
MSYSHIKITSWGVKIDLQGIIFVAAITALSFVINTMAIPVAPSLWMKFGSSVGGFVGVCCGPMWNALSTMASVAYVGIVIHGDVFGVFVAGLTGFTVSVIDKWIPPLANAVFSSPLTGMASLGQQIFLTGTPIPLAVQIFLKRIANAVISMIVFTVLYSMPGIYRYVPMYYDSWVARYWLMKLEEEEAYDE